MQNFQTSKVFFISGLLLLFASCNSYSSKENDTKNEIKNDTAPPQPPPPTVEMTKTSFSKKCYGNKGLKYSTNVNIIYLSDTTVAGQITSYNLENYKEETTGFEGMVIKDKLNIKLTTPVIGAASDWTNKPWVIKNVGGKESLLITTNVKKNNDNSGEKVCEFTSCK
jgi:hypothetical protein